MTSRDLLASLTTLHLFSKVRPDLLVPHADTLQPYLAIKCSVSTYFDHHQYNINICLAVILSTYLYNCRIQLIVWCYIIQLVY